MIPRSLLFCVAIAFEGRMVPSTILGGSYIDEPVLRTGSGGLSYYHRNQRHDTDQRQW